MTCTLVEGLFCAMSEGTSQRKESGHSWESLTERELREEAEIAAVGDVEAARERSIEEKLAHEPHRDDPFLVQWSGDNDPENPLNFSTTRKFSLMAMVAAIAFLT